MKFLKENSFGDNLYNYQAGGYSINDAFNDEDIEYMLDNRSESSINLYRVQSYNKDNVQVGSIISFKDGKSFTKSTSGLKQIIKDTYDYMDDDFFIFKTQGKILYFDTTKYEFSNPTFRYQDEVIVWGKFKIVKIDKFIDQFKKEHDLIIIKNID